ncbi:natterin-3-like isoform 2-T2 [Liasis olivaceus]
MTSLLIFLFCVQLPLLITSEEIPPPCVFPFVYQGKSYTSCIEVASENRPWCATVANYDTSQQWKYCATKEYGGNSGGRPCVFPFNYKGHTYYTCTNEDEELGRFWCSTSGNYDKDARWSYCADTRLDTRPTGPCIFPFIYRDISYSSCTADGDSSGKFWCSLSSNYDVDPKWVYCDHSGLDSSPTGPCIFPFIYKGRSYSSCTTDGESSGEFWCSLSSNYDVDPKWAYCDHSGKAKGSTPDVFHGTTMSWTWFPGYVPSGAVAYLNHYASRVEYPCMVSDCSAGFYSPSLGPSCYYPYGNKEYSTPQFWILVNEHEFESLSWKGDSWGGVPSNSINTCTGVRLYVGKNRYGLGKVDSENKAFFLSSNGEESWYKSYDVLTIDKDYRSQSMSNVRYMLNQGSYNESGMTLASSKLTNKDCRAVKKTTTLSGTVTSEHTWGIGTSISLGLSFSMTAGIPEVLGGSWSISLEKTFTWNKGYKYSQSTTYTETVEVEVPANHICELVMTGTKMRGNIPFTATATRYYRNGSSRSVTVQGVSHNIVGTKGESQVERCVPIRNAPPCNT